MKAKKLRKIEDEIATEIRVLGKYFNGVKVAKRIRLSKKLAKAISKEESKLSGQKVSFKDGTTYLGLEVIVHGKGVEFELLKTF